MNCVVALFALLVVVVSGQRILPLGTLAGTSDEYAASLGGAPVGVFGRASDQFGGTEVHGASLAGAKVGLYGRDGSRRRGVLPAVPVVRPGRILDPSIFRYPYLPYRPFLPYRSFFPYGPFFPSSSVAASGAVADALRQRTAAGSFGYQGPVRPIYG